MVLISRPLYGEGNKQYIFIVIPANVVIKLLYVFVNIGGFWFTDKILNYRYRNYVSEWIKWSQLNNTMAYRFGDRGNVYLSPKPGDYLLPSLGFCDVVESYHDNLDVHSNKYKTICEISPHILYQYVLLVMWFVLVSGIMVSMVGFLYELFNLLVLNVKLLVKGERRKQSACEYVGGDCEHLTFRELQYMKYIRKKNDIMYSEICNLLRRDKTL